MQNFMKKDIPIKAVIKQAFILRENESRKKVKTFVCRQTN